MKNLHSRLPVIGPFLNMLFIILGKSKPFVYGFILLIVLGLSGCYLNYYRTNTKPFVYSTDLRRLQSQNKYFIVHFLNSTNGLEDVSVSGDTLHGKLVLLSNEHVKYLHPKSPEKSRFKKADSAIALMEVHLYTNLSKNRDDSIFSERLTVFNRSDVYEFNKAYTHRNHVLSTVGIVATVVGAGLFIAAAITLANDCNCPQLYVDNAGKYTFTSGLYSGAVYSTLERLDYLPLSKLPTGTKSISFKIANEKNEEQFINTVRLMQVNHLPGVNVLPDRHGNTFSYSAAASPLSVLTGKNDDIKNNVLTKTDEVYYSFDNSPNENGLSDVVLTFNKPQYTNKAKLIIHARNTYWGGLLHKEFINLFGNNFEKWQTKQEKADPMKLEKWQTDQALPLMVYIKSSKGWKFVDYFPLIGNTATRDLIMEIDTKGNTGDKIELKLETAYKFWDLDFAGVDFSTSGDLTKTYIDPDKAITSDSTDQRNVLSNSDKQYVHLVNDESIYFKYTFPDRQKDTISSYFLVSGGYYHNLERITGKTNYSQLYKFRKKAAFDKFSREKYEQSQQVATLINGFRSER